MSRVYRIDRAELRPPRKRADGSVRYDAILSRVGVFPYRRADGTIRREYRSPEEVGRADSLASLELIPVTDGHPPKAGMAKRQAVGSVGDRIDFDGKHVRASVVILDDDINARIARGDIREMSPGYSVVLDETPGVSPEGEPYDASQMDIVYEHHALVHRGRQGSTVALKTDGADADDGWRADAAVQIASWGGVNVSVTSRTLSQVALEARVRAVVESTPDVYIRTDAVDANVAPGYALSEGMAVVGVSTRDMSLDALIEMLKTGLASVDAQVAPPTVTTDRADAVAQEIRTMEELKKKLDAALAELAAATARADTADGKAKTEAARADKAEGERDAAKARADKADQERADAIAAAPDKMRARLKLEDTATRVLGEEFKADALDDIAIQRAVVGKLTGKELPADKSAEYVRARFDACMEDAAASAGASAELRTNLTPPPGVRSDVSPVEEARKQMLDRHQAAGTKPLTNGSN